MADNLTVFNTDYTGVTGIKAKGTGNGILTYIRPQGTKTITENGTVDVSNYMNAEVNVSGGSSGSSGDSGNWTDPIRFFDYDGTLVASYKSVPSTLPDVPMHAKLTNGTWNHTLAQVASQFASIGTCDVGANYDTASGKNEIDVTLDSDHLEPWLCIAINGTATVDWGDGSTTDTITGTSLTKLRFVQHTYTQMGDYTIMIDGTISFYNESSNFPAVLRPTNDTSTNRQYSQAYSKCVTAVRIANGSRLDKYAFQYCYSLASVSIPEGVTGIRDNAFNNCCSLTSISIPSSAIYIGSYAFSKCSSLASVSIPEGVTSINTYAFNNCYSLADVSIPEGVTSIDNFAFQYCYSLASVSMPKSVTSIGTNMFNGCASLTSVSMPKSVTNIGTNAFNNCYSLTSISIPSSATYIGSYAFSNCYGTYEYHLKSTTPPTLAAKNVFNGIMPGTKIYVPAGSLEAYKTATNWSAYANYMIEE